MSKRKIKRKIFTALGCVLLLSGLLALLFSGDNKQVIIDIFSGQPIETILEEVQSLGWQGGVVFGALSMLQVILTFLPAEPVQVLAGISYGLWVGVGICMVGVVIGNSIIYILYKVYGARLNDYFHKKIEVDFDVLRSSKRVTLLIFILYFLPAIPYGLICFFTASLNTRYPRYIIVTTLGSLPSVVIGVALGHITTNNWIVSLVILAVLIVVIVLLYVFRSKVFGWLNRFAKKQFNYTSATKVKKPNAAFNAIIFAGLKTWLRRRVKCKIKRNGIKKLDHPAIVLCNHGSFIDFMYFSMLLSKEKPQVVSNRQYFYEKRLGNLLKRLGCIPKSMFSTDVENVRNCLSVIKNNGVLVICPEARLSTAGDFEDIQPGTMSFLRKMGAQAAIYTIKFGGDYLAMPKWARKDGKRYIRKGSTVEAELNLLYAKGESGNVTLEEFERQVLDALDYNDVDWLAAHPEIHYPQGNLAEGLENILYRCPKCGSEFQLSTKGNAISCDHCGYTDVMDDRYAFTSADRSFDNLQQWYHWQLDEMEKQKDADPEFELRDNVTLFHESDGGARQLTEAGKGECVFNRQGLTYTGTDGGVQITKFFPLNCIYRLLFGADEDFEIYEGDHFWYFVPSDRRTCVKWYMASILLCQQS